MIGKIGWALALVFILAGPLGAEIRDFGSFTLDVPPTWTADQDEDGVYVAANDGSSVLSIMTGELDEGRTLEELARELTEKFRGLGPRDLGAGEAFAFSYIDSTTGNRAVALISAVGRDFIYITQLGENEEADWIVGSLRAN